jgi:hypothetical protein
VAEKLRSQAFPNMSNMKHICLARLPETVGQEISGQNGLDVSRVSGQFCHLNEMVDRFAACLTDFGSKRG